MTDTNPSPTESVTVPRELLVDIRDNGLIYWEPKTERGFIARTEMVNQIGKALAPTPTAREQALEGLREFLDAADGALDKDTYGQFKGEDKIPDDADVIIQFGTQRKINALFAALDRALAKSSPPTGEGKPQQKGGVQWSTSLTTKIECAIGGAYEFPDARKFWIDGPVAREITRRVCAAIHPRAPTPDG